MSYGGEVTPSQCFNSLKANKDSVLVDVRTHAEWVFVGLPDIRSINKEPVLQQWQRYPDMATDPGFVEDLSDTLTKMGLDVSARLNFLCRSGVRSLSAASAMFAAGYLNSFNVAGGFEGEKNKEGHRGHVNGWKAEGLPWKQ